MPERQQELATFFENLGQATEAGDTSAHADLFLPDAALFVPHRQPVLGREQIGNWFDNFSQTVNVVLDSDEQEDTKILGDVAMVRSRGVGPSVLYHMKR